jgi:DMSO/TMAO reductase YedYZ molybdopterin-dependent catalytic subunit
MQTATPPGQTFAKRWAIYTALGVPKVDLKSWRLCTKGLVERELNLSYEELQKLPQLTLTRDFHCLAPQSVVFANPQPKPVEDIKVGDQIIGLDGRRHFVRRLIQKQHDGKLLRIKASYLPAVSVTPDHKVWAVRGHPGEGRWRSHRRELTFRESPRPAWIPASELNVGDYVFFPKCRQLDKRRTITSEGHRFRIDNSLAFILGWYVAEGSGGDSKGRVIRFALNTSQSSQARKLATALKRSLEANVSVYRERNMNLVTVTSSRIKNLGCLLKDWCGENAFSKQIPDFILNAKPRILQTFISALIEGDGYCPWRFNSNRSKASREDFLDITTASKKLAHQLVLALSKLGAPADLVDHPGSVRNSFSVRVRGFDQIRRVIPNVKTQCANGVDRKHYWTTSDGFYYPIRKIRSLSYKGPVYDFTADGFTMLSPFATLDCVTTWSIKDVVWEGVAFRELAKLTGVRPEVKWVMFHCADGYTAPVPLEDVMVEDSLVALKMNGKPIPVQQGFPARPFIPHLYGWKSAKWLTEIEFLAEYKDRYWEAYGYHERGNIWDEERFKGQGGKHVRHRGLGTLPI